MFVIFKKLKELHPHHYHINFLLIITILLIVLIIILAKPALLGYKISKQFEDTGMSVAEFLKEMDLLKSELLVSKTNLESCKSLNEDVVKDLSNERNASFRCMQDKNIMESEYKSLIQQCEFNLSRLQPDFENQKKELDIRLEQEKVKFEEAKADYEALLKNAARNICCKAKVDNKEIDSYIISNHMIICTSGEENKISC